jgi:hypothetical protein
MVTRIEDEDVLSDPRCKGDYEYRLARVQRVKIYAKCLLCQPIDLALLESSAVAFAAYAMQFEWEDDTREAHGNRI